MARSSQAQTTRLNGSFSEVVSLCFAPVSNLDDSIKKLCFEVRSKAFQMIYQREFNSSIVRLEATDEDRETEVLSKQKLCVSTIVVRLDVRVNEVT